MFSDKNRNLPGFLYWDNLLNFLGSYFLTFPKVLKWTTFFPNSGSATSSAASATSSAACIYYVVIGWRFAPPYKYMIKYMQQKKWQKQQKKWQKQQKKQQQQLQQQLQQQHLYQFHFNLLSIPLTKYSESSEILSQLTNGCTKTVVLSIPNKDYPQL